MENDNVTLTQEDAAEVELILEQGSSKSEEVFNKVSEVLEEEKTKRQQQQEILNALKNELITDPHLLAEVAKYIAAVRKELWDCTNEKAKGKVTINLTYKMDSMEEWDVKATLPSKKG